MNDILFLEPIFKERIWGGKRLEIEYGYSVPFESTGECWAISAHPNGDCKITNGLYKKKKLSEVYEEHKELFNDYPLDRFPLITKILDAHEDLSIQVHPNDIYARNHHIDSGKNECWYILDAKENAYIIYGHHAKSKESFKSMVDKNQWDELLIKVPVKKGDFIYVPAGTVHAIGKGLLVLEIQQSSDTTFRLYDYNRKDIYGNPRDLHITSAIEVSLIPHIDQSQKTNEIQIGSNLLTRLIKSSFFEVEKWQIDGVLTQPSSHFSLMSVIDGKGKVNGVPIHKGNHFIVTSNVDQIVLEGNMDIIVSRPKSNNS